MEVSRINNQIKESKVNQKAIFKVVIILLLLSFSYLLLLYKNEGSIKQIELSNITQSTNFEWNIEELNFNQNFIYLKGIFYKEGEPINSFDNKVLLREIKSQIVYELPTESFPKEAAAVEEDETIYRNILAVAKSEKLDLLNQEYEILFLYESNGEQSYQDTGYTVKSWSDENEK